MTSTRSPRRTRTAPAPEPPVAPGFDPAGPLDPTQGVAAFGRALEAGELWYPALLAVVGHWVTPEELVGGVRYRYLVAAEAFDWLRLAQRLLESAPELVPAAEAEQLVVFGLGPQDSDEEEFARAIGPQKYRLHLNFQYGVVVEEALLLAAELELHKAGGLAGLDGGAQADVRAYERVYGRPCDELLGIYRAETGEAAGEQMGYVDLQAFTYWCSKLRFRTGEPARVASDTRKALALLSTMEASRGRLGRRSHGAVREIALKG